MHPPARASSLWQQANRKPAFIQRFAYGTAKSEQGEKVKCKYLVTVLALRLARVSPTKGEQLSLATISQVLSYRTPFPGSKNMTFPCNCLSLRPSFSPFMAKAPYHGHTPFSVILALSILLYATHFLF